jgi:UDP:flavonoid glycosyltransferase YjiC (YdhE family)
LAHEARSGKRVVFTTFGSLGDLHPSIAIGLGLRTRGHAVSIATSETYRRKVEGTGLGFHPVRPHLPDPATDPELMARVIDNRRGSEEVINRMLMPALRDSYADTLAAAAGADLLISHPLTYATRLVAETTGIGWASTVLQPLGFFSIYDPPVFAAAPAVARLRLLGPLFHRFVFHVFKWTVRSWSSPWYRLRAELGLPPATQNPVFEGQQSPSLVLALFSSLLGTRQPDWPVKTVITGFPFYDRNGVPAMPPALVQFLADGPPPIVFTLGTSAVTDAGAFYQHSIAAARLLDRRAVLLVGKDPRNRPPALPEGIVAFDYVPYSDLFPRAAAIVHQGGIGTTAQAMRAGRPMLVMPYGHDQPDNGARVARLGIARVISRRDYRPRRAAAELRRLLDDPTLARRAAEVGRRVRAEDGVAAACDAIEQLLSHPAVAVNTDLLVERPERAPVLALG